MQNGESTKHFILLILWGLMSFCAMAQSLAQSPVQSLVKSPVKSADQSAVQSPPAFQRSLFFEWAGSGGLGSLNYEKPLQYKGNVLWTGRLGVSLAPIDKNNGTGIVFPVMVNALIGAGRHKCELGVGQGLTLTTKGSFFALTTLALGYRYQSESKRWFYRVTYTPLVSYWVDFQVQQWAGVSVGYTLKGAVK